MGPFRRGTALLAQALLKLGRQQASLQSGQSYSLCDLHNVARVFSRDILSKSSPNCLAAFSTVHTSLYTAASTCMPLRQVHTDSPAGSSQQLHTDALRVEHADTHHKVAQAQQVLQHLAMSEAKKVIENESHARSDMGYEEFVQWCIDQKVANSAQSAEALLKQMRNAGVLLQYQDRVYLRPEEIAESIIQSLAALHPNDEAVKRLAEQLRHMEAVATDIEKQADRQTNKVLWGTFMIMATQFTIFMWLTFTEPGWDVMQPVTFFWFYFTGLMCYLYFLLTRKEFSWENLRENMLQKMKEKHADDVKFDMSEYERLAARLQRHAHLLKRVK